VLAIHFTKLYSLLNYRKMLKKRNAIPVRMRAIALTFLGLTKKNMAMG
jgi:hypothetical protein